MKRFEIAFCGVVLSALACAAPVKAGVVTKTYSFTGSNFISLISFTPGVPIDPFSGEFSITFDPTQNVSEQLSGIHLISLSLPLASAISYTFDGNSLLVGGAQNRVHGLGPNDFFIDFSNVLSATPTFNSLLYAYPGGGLFKATTGSVASVAVPEPAAWALMVAGFGLIGVMARRRPPFVAA